jgi:hypothetical protein
MGEGIGVGEAGRLTIIEALAIADPFGAFL